MAEVWNGPAPLKSVEARLSQLEGAQDTMAATVIGLNKQVNQLQIDYRNVISALELVSTVPMEKRLQTLLLRWHKAVEKLEELVNQFDCAPDSPYAPIIAEIKKLIDAQQEDW